MTAQPPLNVLVIDDEIQIRRLLRLTLEGAGYRVTEADTGRAGLESSARDTPQGVVLDLGLPDMDGCNVLRRLREYSRVPVVVLSVREGEEAKIGALDAGADDYLTKPFSGRELLARIRAVLRRVQGADSEPVVGFGELEVDLAARVVRRAGQEVKLAAKEYAILRMLVQHRGRVITHRDILREVWGSHALECTHYLRVQMTHLRKKLEADPQAPRHLRTEPGVGYRLVE